MEFDQLSNKILGCAIEVHKRLGPGLLETTYEKCLEYELIVAGISCVLQSALPIVYKEVELDCSYRIDILVENEIIVELKSIEKLLPIHQAQLLTYMKLSNKKIGILINFNEVILKNGIKRMVL
jgi:GxxExxY protein